jgi:uncharacterized glyoxalase superfamily protein PhnB
VSWSIDVLVEEKVPFPETRQIIILRTIGATMSQATRYAPNQNEFRFVFFTPAGRFNETLAFYRDHLRLPYKGGFGDDNSPVQGAYIEAACGVIEMIADRQGSELVRSVLAAGQEYQPATGGYLLIEVENVDALYENLVQEKANFQQPIHDWPWGFRDFKIQDPCGNTVCLFSRVQPT